MYIVYRYYVSVVGFAEISVINKSYINNAIYEQQ